MLIQDTNDLSKQRLRAGGVSGKKEAVRNRSREQRGFIQVTRCGTNILGVVVYLYRVLNN